MRLTRYDEYPHSLAETLEQTRWWHSRESGWVRVRDMTPSHRIHLLAFLERQADEILSAVIAQTDRLGRRMAMTSFNGEAAQDALEYAQYENERDLGEYCQIKANGEATAWMRRQPFYRRLSERVAKQENDPTWYHYERTLRKLRKRWDERPHAELRTQQRELYREIRRLPASTPHLQQIHQALSATQSIMTQDVW